MGLALWGTLAPAFGPAFASAQGAAQGAAQRAAPRGSVHTDTLFAYALGTRKALTVYLPPSYGHSGTRYPVLVYLHGLGGNERNWTVAGHLQDTMDSLVAAGAPEAILVMPDGDDGWYTTAAALPDAAACAADSTRREPAASYCVPWPHYDDYVAFDVLQHVDRHYRTLADGRHRGIAGLSMGGYGAITLALRFPEHFRAAASHSGVLAPRLLPAAAPGTFAGTAVRLPEFRAAARSLWPSQRIAFGTDSIAWWARDPATLAARLAARAAAGQATVPALRMDCGVDDPWIAHNRSFRDALRQLGVTHEYVEAPGAHTWSYWRAHAVESLRFLLSHVAAP